jgi:MYXO-CTERM domain-containing protein
VALAESVTKGAAGTPGSTRPNALIYAIAALTAAVVVVLWLRRKRKKQDVS